MDEGKKEGLEGAERLQILLKLLLSSFSPRQDVSAMLDLVIQAALTEEHPKEALMQVKGFLDMHITELDGAK